jgi:CIC family chloride channel protein
MTPKAASPTRPDRNLLTIAGLGVAVGAVGGLGAWIFRLMIGVVHNLLFLGKFSLSYDANVHTAPSPWAAAVILVPVVGGLGVVYIVEHFAPEAKGHGVPEVMEAVYYQSGVIRPAVAAFKATASALSIGSGGSVGREGPIIQIGAAFGSTLGQYLRLSPADLRVLIAGGAAAGIAATFNAPIGGVLFAVELLLVTVSTRSVLVVGAAVATGVGVARTFLGYGAAFTVLSLERIKPIRIGWPEALALAAAGILLGLASAWFVRSLYWAEDRFDGGIRNAYLRHVSGMLVVGLAMYGTYLWHGSYSIEGVGYATIIDILRETVSNPWILLALGGGKWLATILTLGSGASGGIFSPALFMGATIGGAMGQFLVLAGWHVDPVVFALGGMVAIVAGTTGAVLTAIAMVTEMTGDFGAVIPLLIVAAVAAATRNVFSPTSIYTEKLARRGHPIPEGLRASGYGILAASDPDPTE